MAEEGNERFERLTEPETRVIENLRQLNEFASQENFDSENLRGATRIVLETLDWIAESAETADISLTLQVLELIEILDQKVDFSSRTGDSKIPYMIFYNRSTCYQLLWEMENSGKYLEKSIEALQRMIIERSPTRSNNYEKSAELTKLRFLLVKAYLQNAAILSQRAEHEKALENAMRAKNELKKLGSRLLEISKDRKIGGSNMLKKFMGSDLPQFLETFVDEIQNKDPTEIGEGEKRENMSKKLIFWKHNIENNEIYLRRELANRFGNIFEKEKLTTHWLDEFNIGNIMHLTPITHRSLDPNYMSLEQIFEEEYVIEIILVYACCLFSIATENRFICHKELKKKNTPNQNALRNTDSNPVDGQRESEFTVENITKNYHLQQNKNFQQSEIYHFKAIEILCLFVEDCPLLEHFKGSYHKNYSPDLIMIAEEEESKRMNDSMMSLKSTATEEYQQRQIMNRSIIYKERDSKRSHSKSKEFIDLLKAKYYKNEMKGNFLKEELKMEHVEREKVRIEKEQLERDKVYQKMLFKDKLNLDERDKKNKTRRIFQNFDFIRKNSSSKKKKKSFDDDGDETSMVDKEPFENQAPTMIKLDREFKTNDLSHSSNGKAHTKETKDKSSFEKEDGSVKSNEANVNGNGLKNIYDNIIISSYKGSPFSTPVPEGRLNSGSTKKFTIENNLEVREKSGMKKQEAEGVRRASKGSTDKKFQRLYSELYCDEEMLDTPDTKGEKTKAKPKKARASNDNKIRYDYIKQKIAGMKSKNTQGKKKLKNADKTLKRKTKSPIKMNQRKNTHHLLSSNSTSKILSSLKSKHSLNKVSKYSNSSKKEGEIKNMFSCNEITMKDFMKMHRGSDNNLKTITKKVFMKTKEKRYRNKQMMEGDKESFLRKMKPSYLKIIKKTSRSAKSKSKNKFSSPKYPKKSPSSHKRSLSKKFKKKNLTSPRSNSKKSKGLKLRKYSHKISKRGYNTKSSMMLSKNNSTFNKLVSRTPKIKSDMYSRAMSERSKKSPLSSRKVSTQRPRKSKGYKLEISNLKKYRRKTSTERFDAIYGKKGKKSNRSPLKNNTPCIKTKRSYSCKERNLGRNYNLFTKTRKTGNTNSTSKMGGLKSIPHDSISLLNSMNQVDLSTMSNQIMKGYQHKANLGANKKNKYFTNLIKNMHQKKKEKPSKLASIYSSSNSRINMNYPYTERACYSKAFTFKKGKESEPKSSLKSKIRKEFKRKISAHTFFGDRKDSNISDFRGGGGLRDNIRNLLERKLSKSRDKKSKLFSRKRSKLLGVNNNKDKKLNRSSTSRLLGKGFTSDRKLYF